MGLQKNNKTGVTGVSKTPSGKYRARIMVDRKEICLGTFETLKEAAIARENGEIKYFGEFSRIEIEVKELENDEEKRN